MKLIQKYSKWMFGARNLGALVICRIGFGLIIFFSHLQRMLSPPTLEAVYSERGFWGRDFFARVPAALEYNSKHFGLFELQSLPLSLVYAVFALIMISSLCFAVGFHTRKFGWLMVFLLIFLDQSAIHEFWGWYRKCVIFSIYLLCSPAICRVSLSEWIKDRRLTSLEQITGEAWPLRLLQIHVCTIYFVSATSRIDKHSWYSGDMVYQMLMMKNYTRFDIDWMLFYPALFIITYATLILELLAPFLLWTKKFAPWMIGGLVVLHSGIELTLFLGYWSHTMIVALMSFLPNSALQKVFSYIPSWSASAVR